MGIHQIYNPEGTSWWCIYWKWYIILCIYEVSVQSHLIVLQRYPKKLNLIFHFNSPVTLIEVSWICGYIFIWSASFKGGTFYSLLVTCYFLLVVRYFLLVTCCFLLITRSFLLDACYFLLVTHCFLRVSCYFLLVTRYFLLVTCYVLFALFYSLLVATYSVLITLYSYNIALYYLFPMFTLSYVSFPQKKYKS